MPRTGEIFLDDRSGGAAVLASVQLGDGGQWQQYVLREGQPALRIATYEDRIIAGAIAKDGTVYGLSRKDAPRGKILRLAAPYAGGFAAAATIIAEVRDTAVVDGGELGSPLAISGDRLFVTRIAGDTDVVFTPFQVAANANQIAVLLKEQGKRAVVFGGDGTADPAFKVPGSFFSNFAPDLNGVAGKQAIINAWKRDNPERTLQLVRRLNPFQRVIVHTIGLGSGIDDQFLRRLATENGGVFVQR